MLDYHLSDSELTSLRVAHRKMKDRKQADRFKAVYLLGKGWSANQVAEALLVDDDTVREWFKRYRKGGKPGLLNGEVGGSQGYLSTDQQALLRLHLEETLHLTSSSVHEYIKTHSKVCYSARGLTELLNRLGFRFKKTKLVPGKADPEKQAGFLVELGEIRRTMKPADDLYYMDAMHPQHNTQVGYGWIRQGTNYWVRSNSGRQRLNINGAFSTKQQRPIIRLEETVNAEATLRLFDDMQKAQPRGKLHVIADNARYYRCHLVADYLKRKRCRIRLHFLPPYSPNLNLIERLWGLLKREVIYNRYYEKFAHFKMAVMDFFRHTDKYAEKIQSLMVENFGIMKI